MGAHGIRSDDRTERCGDERVDSPGADSSAADAEEYRRSRGGRTRGEPPGARE